MVVESLCNSSSSTPNSRTACATTASVSEGMSASKRRSRQRPTRSSLSDGQLRRGQPEQFRGVPRGPLADAVEGLARDQEVLEQDQEGGGGGDAATAVLAGQMVAEELLEAEPPEEAVEDRQGGDAVRGQGPGGDAGGRAGGVWWLGLVIRSARRLPHGSVPSTHPVGLGSGGRSAATSADMVVRGGGTSRGENTGKILTSTRLDVSRAALDLRRGGRRKSRRGGFAGRPGHCPCVGQGEESLSRQGRGAPGTGPGSTPASTPGEDDPTFDQLKGNSEIMRARCANSV